jgi:hypothetical protein
LLCLCNRPGLAIQIHHIDEDASNNDAVNLAVLCLQHHEETQIRGGFSKKLKAADVKVCRDDWLERVRERKREADRIVVARMSNIAVKSDSHDWERPSRHLLVTTIQTLPLIYEDVYTRADPYLSSIVRGDMLKGLQMVLDVFAESWVRLVAWYPPKHFGNVRAEEYIAAFIAERNATNLALWEPDGPGSGGREAAIYALGETVTDVERLLGDLVEALGRSVEDFDYGQWQTRWKSVWKQAEKD